MESKEENRGALAQIHSMIAMTLLVALLVAIGGIDLLARNPWINERLDENERIRAQQRGLYYDRKGNFIDLEDELLFDILPSVDYSQGGVYFFGSSNIKWATKPWALQGDDLKRIHNFGMGGSNQLVMFEFIKFLVEREEMLRAGGEKSLVVLCLCYQNIGHDIGFFGPLWNRYGLYEYTPEAGVRRLPNFAFQRFIVAERQRIAGFLQRIGYITVRSLRDLVRPLKPGVRFHDVKAYNDFRTKMVGPNWREKLDQSVEALSQTIDYLESRNVRVAIVLSPQGTWEENLPFSKVYNERIRALCKQRSVRLVDLGGLLSDDEFGDSLHPNLEGVEKVDAILMKLAREHLDKTPREASPPPGLNR